MATPLLHYHTHDPVIALLDAVDAMGTSAPDDDRFYSREKAAALIQAVLWAYGSRKSSTAGAMAAMEMFHALGLKTWTFDEKEAQIFQNARNATARVAMADAAPVSLTT